MAIKQMSIWLSCVLNDHWKTCKLLEAPSPNHNCYYYYYSFTLYIMFYIILYYYRVSHIIITVTRVCDKNDNSNNALNWRRVLNNLQLRQFCDKIRLYQENVKKKVLYRPV